MLFEQGGTEMQSGDLFLAFLVTSLTLKSNSMEMKMWAQKFSNLSVFFIDAFQQIRLSAFPKAFATPAVLWCPILCSGF